MDIKKDDQEMYSFPGQTLTAAEREERLRKVKEVPTAHMAVLGGRGGGVRVYL